ncbi:SPOR domain-containing protein [Paraglaciecola psychrophila]|uniref:Sporulation-like protein n=1 Tax=Paraglaciecola psychrophila 170 TaxID=1129794 RepID=K7AS56_9ALTE|nr:SPOR domain-containing protein [Paraglaciecola psychrophila]AGH45442.1 sporulation-like protein [Paraglaciecola psychrophila 170]GAC38110.1 DedD protein [Paraglaciecola psychrophila 170]
MSSALQNRLVGTAIVVAIVVIFLPDLLDGKQESKRDLFVKLPQKPSMKTVQSPSSFDTDKVKEAATRKVEVISEQAVDDNLASNLPAATKSESRTTDVQVPDVYQASESAAVVQTSKANKTKTSSLQQQTVVEQDVDRLLASAGWVVQLGSFRHQKNVKELLNRLEKAGYRAFSRPVKTNSGILTKVFVGPDLQKNNLENALSHLKELTNLQGRVTPFTVQ